MDNLKPITRTENFLAAAAGDPAEDLTPETREEYFLSRLKGGGGGGESTIAWKPSVSDDGTISWTRTSSTTKPDDQNIKGPKGDIGDEGPKGDAGEKGEDGDPGVSPSVTITDITGGHRVTITDKDHPEGQTFDVMDGEGGESGKVFVAEYNTTSAQDILAYMSSENEPCAPIVVKRGGDYYTAIIIAKRNDESVYIRTFGSMSGDYYIFNYTVTNSTWSSSTYGLQKRLPDGGDVGQALIKKSNANQDFEWGSFATEDFVTESLSDYWNKTNLKAITDEEIDVIIV